MEKAGSVFNVELDKVQADERPLDKGIMKSMAAVGQLYPIIAIYDTDTDEFQVWDGRVRVRCAQELGWETIKVLPAADEFEAERKAAAIGLAANLHASNPLSEGEMLVELDDDEYAMEAAGLTRAEVRSRRKLAEGLIDEVKKPVADGRLSVSAAKKLVRLPKDEQGEAYAYAKELMEKHNEERRRKNREVPTVGEVDAAVRKAKGKMQPSIPVMSGAQEGDSTPDPVTVASLVRRLAQGDDYTDEQRATLRDAADVLET